MLYWPPKEARVRFASKQCSPPRLPFETIIEKACFEDVAHAYARMRRITRLLMNE